eukprot:TRINITY_DN3226_c0_g3_i1.p1 TRINITY_DN3226_c0_g3~~TRINITY_DN3226_c0_g3_i1.p1  ORF type:complete len:772 (-),score=-170.68 TRINITY_DN3226_c0_g3_i1:2552-4867(-)
MLREYSLPRMETNWGQKHAVKARLKEYLAISVINFGLECYFKPEVYAVPCRLIFSDETSTEIPRGPNVSMTFWSTAISWRTRTKRGKYLKGIQFNALSGLNHKSKQYNKLPARSYSTLTIFQRREEVRGSIVLNLRGRDLNIAMQLLRLYTTNQNETTADVAAKGNTLGLNQLKLVYERSLKPGWKHEKLFSIMRFEDLWITAYGKLRHNQGSTTPGVDDKTIDGISRKELLEIRDMILSGKYEWNTIKRIEIPKPNGKTRPLGIPTFRDRVVQEVLRSLLEAVYESNFSSYSHGFRPGRSIHTAIKEVRKTFVRSTWVIEGDISKFFDTVNHDILINLLKKRIDDNKLIKLIQKGLQSKILLPNGLIIKNEKGTPQGGICSPLLSNIYLHELDIKTTELKKLFDKGKERRSNPLYNNLQNQGYRARQIRAKNIRFSDPMDPNYRRLHYVRYADDFIVGVEGSLKEAKDIRELLAEFLRNELKLELNMDKTIISKWNQDIAFLGYRIRQCYVQAASRIHNKIVPQERKILKILADREKVVKKLATAGFCTPRGYPLPNFKFLHQSQDLTNRRAAELLRGLCEYYKLAEDRKRSITYFAYIIRFSLAKLYAAKFRLHTVAKVFKKSGVHLDRIIDNQGKGVGAQDSRILQWGGATLEEISKKRVTKVPYATWKEVTKPDRTFLIDKRNLAPVLNLELIFHRITRLFDKGLSSLNLPCLVCGTFEQIEMHHVRKIADQPKGRSIIHDRLKAAGQKIIPLCRKHHEELHYGKRE